MIRSPPPPARVESNSDKPRPDHGSGPRRLAGTGALARPRILIVDDDDDTRDMYAWCMRAAGWNVEDVADGVDALAIAASFAPNVILMDLRLPMVDGLETTRLLKANAQTRHIPVLALSGGDRSETEALAVAAGCEAFVPKPCPPEHLRSLLEQLVRGRDESSAW